MAYSEQGRSRNAFWDKEIDRPKSLPSEVQTDFLGKGSFVKAATLENLPPDFAAKIPDGFSIKEYPNGLVIKEYHPQPSNYLTNDDLTEGAIVFDFLEDSEEKRFLRALRSKIDEVNQSRGKNKEPLLSEQEVRDILNDETFNSQFGGRAYCKDLYYHTYTKAAAEELKKRHAVTAEYFADTLPNLVVPTHIFIDTEVKNDQKRIYEIQPKVKAMSYQKEYYSGLEFDPEDPMKILGRKISDEFVDYLKAAFSPATIELFKKELAIFIQKIKEMPEKTGYFPHDCSMIGNLIFTDEGLRLIDTNLVLRMPDEFNATDDEKKKFDHVVKQGAKFYDRALEVLLSKL